MPHRSSRLGALNVGTDSPSLLGITKTAAWSRLDVEGRARVVQAVDGIAACGLDEDPWLAFREAIAGMFDGAVGAMYTIRDGRVDFIAAPYSEVACRDVVVRHARWTWDQPDRTANRAVSTAELYRDDRDALDAYRAALEPVAPGIGHHARVAIYEHGRMSGWYGALRGRDDAEYDTSELLALQALLPIVRPRMAVMRMLERQSPTADFVTSVLDTLPQRARLVDDAGRKIHGNALDDAHEEESSPPTTVVSVLVDERPHAVELRPPTFAQPSSSSNTEISASMMQVAEAWARGEHVQTIALRTGLTVASVRTYVKRVYRKLGVSSRTQLVPLLFANGGTPHDAAGLRPLKECDVDE